MICLFVHFTLQYVPTYMKYIVDIYAIHTIYIFILIRLNHFNFIENNVFYMAVYLCCCESVRFVQAMKPTGQTALYTLYLMEDD